MMRIVVAGGGNIGYYLVKTLMSGDYHISIIDRNRKRCLLLADMLHTHRGEVICGDATDEQILRDAGMEKADVFIAVTGQDQNNLVACMLAKRCFHAGKIVTRVNNPKNIRIFQAEGVDSVISSASRIAGVIEQELGWGDIDSILATKTEDARIHQFIVSPDSFAAGRTVSGMKLPQGSIIVVAVRGNHAYIPNGDFRREASDEVMIMGPQQDFGEIERKFYEENYAN